MRQSAKAETKALQNELANFIRGLGEYNAVKTHMRPGDIPIDIPEIAFGKSTFNAILTIWTPTRFIINCTGDLRQRFRRTYENVEELKKDLANAVGYTYDEVTGKVFLGAIPHVSKFAQFIARL